MIYIVIVISIIYLYHSINLTLTFFFQIGVYEKVFALLQTRKTHRDGLVIKYIYFTSKCPLPNKQKKTWHKHEVALKLSD